MDKNILKNRLKYTIESNRISRLSQSSQDEMLKDLKERHKKAVGNNKENLSTLIGIIEERQEMAENARVNKTFAEYGGGAENGGCGSGNDSG